MVAAVCPDGKLDVGGAPSRCGMAGRSRSITSDASTNSVGLAGDGHGEEDGQPRTVPAEGEDQAADGGQRDHGLGAPEQRAEAR